MKKSIILSAVLVFCCSSVLYGCGKSDDTVVVTNSSTQNETVSRNEDKDKEPEYITEYEEIQIPPVVGGTDSNGFTVTAVQVTDAKGAEITDTSGAKVTELAVVNKEGAIVTNPQGSIQPPQMPVVTQIVTRQVAESSGSFSEGSVLWITKLTEPYVSVAPDGSSENKTRLKGIPGTVPLFTVTFKISENTPDGNYPVSFGRANGDKGSFCGDDTLNYKVNYVSGNIAVGSAQSPAPAAESGITCSMSSASGTPGSTVKLTCDLKGAGSLAAFNTYYHYNSQYLTLVSVEPSSNLTESGDFVTN